MRAGHEENGGGRREGEGEGEKGGSGGGESMCAQHGPHTVSILKGGGFVYRCDPARLVPGVCACAVLHTAPHLIPPHFIHACCR